MIIEPKDSDTLYIVGEMRSGCPAACIQATARNGNQQNVKQPMINRTTCNVIIQWIRQCCESCAFVNLQFLPICGNALKSVKLH